MGDDAGRCIVIRLNIPPSEHQRTIKSIRSAKNSQTSQISQRFERTRKQLRHLSNKKLLSNLENLNQRERKLKILVLLYLSEIDSRQLYLPMGYSSLFDFCTMHLGYTRATAVRRIRAARTTARYPEALNMLRSGEINITTLSMISDVLDSENHEKLLDSIENKSTRQVEMLVSRHRPVPVIRDIVRPVCVTRRVAIAPEVSGSDSSAESNHADPDAEKSRKSNKISSSAGTNALSRGRVVLEQRLKLGFSVSPEFMAKYNKIKSLLSNKHPEGINFETLFEHLMNEYLERHDPERKRARKLKRGRGAKHESKKSPAGKTKKPRKQGKTSSGDGAGGNSCSGRNCGKRNINQRSRHISPAVRDRVYARDKGRCSFIGSNGKRCDATWDLEIDHIVPFARGGDNSPGNLRLLCRTHNIHQAERAYGKDFMKNRVMKE
jgi:hypothetical protein